METIQKRDIHKKSKRLCNTCGSWEYYDKYYCGHGAFVCKACEERKD